MPFMSQNTPPYRFSVVGDVTGARAVNTTYTNNTGKNLMVAMASWVMVLGSPYTFIITSLMELIPGGGLVNIEQNGYTGAGAVGDLDYISANFLVPPGCSYRINTTENLVVFTLVSWIEAY